MEEDIMGEESMLVDTDQEEDSDADEEKEVIHGRSCDLRCLHGTS